MTTKTEKLEVVADRLEQVGFKNASAQLKLKKIKAQKLAVAYELYRFVRQERIEEFNQELRRKTQNQSSSYMYKTLDFCSIESYANCPPESVLLNLEKAQALTVAGVKVFDSYEVASIQEVKDPLLFGRVNGCSDYFFIDQWGDDVKITDLLKANEG